MTCTAFIFATLAICALANHAPADFNAGVFDGDFQGVEFGASSGTVMNLHMLENTEATGAVCLDGECVAGVIAWSI
jgi:hypothetical protein